MWQTKQFCRELTNVIIANILLKNRQVYNKAPKAFPKSSYNQWSYYSFLTQSPLSQQIAQVRTDAHTMPVAVVELWCEIVCKVLLFHKMLYLPRGPGTLRTLLYSHKSKVPWKPWESIWKATAHPDWRGWYRYYSRLPESRSRPTRQKPNNNHEGQTSKYKRLTIKNRGWDPERMLEWWWLCSCT